MTLAGIARARFGTTALGASYVQEGPRPGEIGCVGSCPLCSHGHGHPPCLACRDELRARLTRMAPPVNAVAMWN